jgi:rifampin ADP-ribosyltransferase
MSAQDNLRPEQFFHGTNADLAPGSKLTPEGAMQQGPWEEAGSSGSGRPPAVFFTSSYKHADMYGSVRAQMRGGKPRVYEVQPEGSYEPNPADEKWREGKPPMSFRTTGPLTVLGEASPPKRKRKAQ